MTEVHEQVARVAAVAEKLLKETERLRRDVARLHQRIEPFEGEAPIPQAAEQDVKIRTLMDALQMLDVGRRRIEGCERALGHMESLMIGISADAISRSEMKPWLKGS